MRRTLFLGCLLLAFGTAGSAFGFTHIVEMTDFAYSQPNLEISPGDIDQWVLVNGTHSTVSLPESPKQWDSGPMSVPGSTFEIVFTMADGPGPFAYHDPPNSEWLSGVINVADTCWAAGDVNGDGLVLTVGDLVHMLRYFAGELPQPEALYQLDLNGDCVIDAGDADKYADYFTYGLSVFPQYPVPTCCFPSTDVGACCLSGDSCSLRSEENCLALGGTFHGYGTTCVENFCVCCDNPAGDIDGNGQVNISDIICFVEWAFCMIEPWFCCEPACPDMLDTNGNGSIDISDLTYLVDYFFLGGDPPLHPSFCFPQ